MMPNRETIERLKERYPEGTRVELISMSDTYAPPTGTQGTVMGVDDIGSLLVHWDNGSSLNVLYGEDTVRIVKEPKPIFKLVYQNGTVKEYATYEEAWDLVTDMVLNDDFVWVDFYPTEHNWDMIRIRKGF
ncbi:DUF4314 domain-containing protein [Listeria monocytogenes]|uniref:DUF4314 domain-containing protein n=1 Tax=Bacilli TaxID=91061 RepID=UPI0009861D41|nr:MULTISPECIES: DUF4314 domain-containing protein [Bacilli]EAC4489566.1 DUF4314 domain-containing protein [Listeria monocytogenes]EAC4490369.1 DUF4314 domain-containing protein [Listeria monocytogenes]EAD4755772.1 DUF4314 domain-containing protein [Listeria monocytogenes]EAE4845190.1 DUF4314 domain-containing protein [Listeria monocytogenes]EAE4846120.1 DUF4314 domain-containing protein [Listeria monocytogenes]